MADADSYVAPEVLTEAVRLVTDGHPWVVPHAKVWRLKDRQTLRIYDTGLEPQLEYGMRLDRGPYRSVPGGGITVLTREAWDTVGGVDPRFRGWGGEDLSFGRALETLCGRHTQLDGDLVHLWHPHPAPHKRGSRETEALASRYLDAYRTPRLMRALIDNRDPDPPVPLDAPVRFVSRNPRLIARRGKTVVARFREHYFETTDPDVVEVLRLHPRAEEVP